MNISPRAGKTGSAGSVGERAQACYGLLRGRSRSFDPGSTGFVRHLRAPGSAFDKAFNEWHILAICQAICLYRAQHHIDGPLFLGMDTHALSAPALASALEVLAANEVEVMIARGGRIYSDPRGISRDFHLQPRSHNGTCRRHRRHAVAQSTT